MTYYLLLRYFETILIWNDNKNLQFHSITQSDFISYFMWYINQNIKKKQAW